MARFGMVGKLVAHPGRRGELLDLLMAATRELQGADGCELYVVSHDRDDLDTIWVYEAWRDEAAHRASLNMPAVRGMIERGLPLSPSATGRTCNRWAA
jgi:quinol monooxygenase YgiN